MDEVDRPTIGAEDALVRVRAVGIPKGNWLITMGLPYIARPMYGLRTPRNPRSGLQFSGVVEEVGPDVDGVSAGQEVFGLHEGSLADYVAVPSESLVLKPEAVSHEQAAAVPVSGITALQAVRDAGGVEAGQHVLIIGASGGVGSFAVQIAKALGAEVTGVASTRNLAAVRGLGADHVIDYTADDPTALGERYDVIVDIAGNRPVSRLRGILTPKGTLVIVGGTGGRLTMGFGRTVGAMLLSRFTTQRLIGLLSQPNRSDLEYLAELMAARKVTPLVGASFPLSRAPEAIQAVGSGAGAGTVVVTV